MIKSILVGSFSAVLSCVMLFGDSYQQETAPKEIEVAEVKTVEQLCEGMPLNKRIIKLEKALHIEEDTE